MLITDYDLPPVKPRLTLAMKWLLHQGSRTKEQEPLEARSERSESTRWNSAKFDQSTGQVYLETTASFPISDHRDWDRDSRIVGDADYEDNEGIDAYIERLAAGKKHADKYWGCLSELEESRNRGSKGARSLQESTIEYVLKNVSDITIEGIERLPHPIVQRLWDAITMRSDVLTYKSVIVTQANLKGRCSRCFNTWSIFSKLLSRDASTMNLLRYHQKIENPSCHLGVYTGPLTSKSFNFITSLSITTSCPVPDLVKLSTVTNLGILEIINTKGVEYIAVGDRLLRSWHIAAVENKAFTVLRILRLWRHEGLTEKSLSYLNGFPALAVSQTLRALFPHFDILRISTLHNLSGQRLVRIWSITLSTSALLPILPLPNRSGILKDCDS